MNGIRPGLLGLGSIGCRHLRNLRSLGVTDIVGFDPDQARAAEARDELAVAVHTDLESFWRSDITVAFVTSPTSMHLEQIREALGRGLDVFVEKPLSHTADGLAAVLDVADGDHRVTMVGCNLRFHPLVKAARSALAEGRIGRVLSFRAEFGSHLPDWHPWEDYRKGYSARRELGGGIVLDAIHELNLVRHMIGEVAEVSCFLANSGALEIDVEDSAAMILRMSGGVIGEVHLDYLQRSCSRSFKIVGTDANLVIDFVEGHVSIAGKGTCEHLVELEPDWDANTMYVDEMRHFIDAVTRRENTVCAVKEGAEDLRIALAAFRSQELGRSVRLGEIEFEK